MNWVAIGIKYLEAKAKGTTAKKFAEENGIKYNTFTSAMSRHKQEIKLAYEAHKLKGKKNLTAKERETVMINSFRSSIKTRIKNEGAAVNNKSEKWFKETLAKGVRGHKVTKPEPGKIYAYIYDAKHKDTLPYWDRYPLIIYLGLGKQGTTTLMYGLNMHYVPPKVRQRFLEQLLKSHANTPVISNSTVLKINWSKVKGRQEAQKMIKAYIPSHIKGKLVEIKPADWANVVLMPLQQFVSKGKRYSAAQVWKDN